MTKVNQKNKKLANYKAIMRKGLNESVRKEKMGQLSGKGLKVNGTC